MANPVIQAYLNDTSIPLERREAALRDIENGVPESQVAAAITYKYGNKYAKQASDEITKGIVKGVLTYAQPGNLLQAAPGVASKVGQAIIKTAPPAPESAGIMTEAPATPDVVNPPDILGTAANILTEATLKPIAKGAATAIIGPIMAASRETITGQGLTEPIEIPWIGNINPNTQTPAQLTGLAGDFWLAYQNLVNPVMATTASRGILTQGARSALQSAAKELEYNREASPLSVGVAATIGGTMGMAAQAIGNWVNNKVTTDKMVQAAKKAGIKEGDINYMKSLSTEQKRLMKDYLAVANNKLQSVYDPDVPMPSEVAADKITRMARDLSDKMDEIGSQIGITKQGLLQETMPDEKVLGTVTEIRDDFVKDLAKRYRIKIGDGVLNFEKSPFINSTGDQQLLQQIYDQLDNIQNMGDVVVAKEAISKNIYTSKVKDVLTGSEGVGEGVRQELAKMLPKDLQELDSIFSRLKPLLTDIEKTTGGTSQALKGEARRAGEMITGTNMWNFARRSLGTGNKQYMDLLKDLQDVGTKYGIEGAGELYDDIVMANIAENITKLEPQVKPTGTQAILGAGWSLAKGKPGQAAKELGNMIKNTASAREAADLLLKEPTLSQEIFKKIFSNRVLQQVAQQIEVSMPQTLTRGIMDFSTQPIK
jgi:hypothetical protein